MSLTRFWGGKAKGVCIQLTAVMEEGECGYIQLSASDIIALLPIFKKYILDFALEGKKEEAEKAIEDCKALRKTIVEDMRAVAQMAISQSILDVATLLCLGESKFEISEEIKGGSMNKPYHERPDWILKSIVYFCDNYTIDGKSLRKLKRGAIETYKEHPIRWETGGRVSIDDALSWEDTPQHDIVSEFWCALWYLQTGGNRLDDPTTCKPWTDYEKRKIAKMPRVK